MAGTITTTPFAPATDVWVPSRWRRVNPQKAYRKTTFQYVNVGDHFWDNDPKLPGATRYMKFDPDHAVPSPAALAPTPTGGTNNMARGIAALALVISIIASGISFVALNNHGAQGPAGPIGPQGVTGLNGTNGQVGATGSTGAQGPSGLQGIAGATGPAGSTGADGTVAAADINTAIQNFVQSNPVVTQDQINQAVSDYMSAHPAITDSGVGAGGSITDGTTGGSNTTGGGDGNAYIGSNFDPTKDYEQSCDPNRTCTYDYGTMGDHMDANLDRHVVQVGIIKGVKISWPQGGKADQPGRCDLVVLDPNNSFNNVVTSDANVTIYNVWEGDVSGWAKTLALQAMQEQHFNPNYNCPTKTYDQIPHWGSPIKSPPCGVEGFANCDVVTGNGGSSSQDSGASDTSGSQTTSNGDLVKLTGLEDNTHGSNGMVRHESVDAPGGALAVKKGESAEGATIQVGSKKYSECYIEKVTSSNVVVYGGTSNFWNEEVLRDNLQPCSVS